MSDRESFTQRELDEVLAQYELGAVTSVREAALGSANSPKAVIESARGRVLLKRRARGVDSAPVVAFSHAVQLSCLAAGVCVPPLVGTRGQNNSMVQIDDRVYELFVFIDGSGYPRTEAAARDAGSLLGELHHSFDAIDRTKIRWEAPIEGASFDPERVDGRGIDGELIEPIRGVLDRAAALAWGSQETKALVHGDWHPGNLVFVGDEPVAVCDFDNLRLGLRAREIAQGLAQFSITRGAQGDSLARWPIEADTARVAAHWAGYLEGLGGDAPDPALVAGMMGAVLLDEALASGADPATLWLVLKKAQWLEDHRDELIGNLATNADR